MLKLEFFVVKGAFVQNLKAENHRIAQCILSSRSYIRPVVRSRCVAGKYTGDRKYHFYSLRKPLGISLEFTSHNGDLESVQF